MKRKYLNMMLAGILSITILFGGTGLIQAGQNQALSSGNNNVLQSLPASATDESKVPHYFGPYPNWANSPFTLENVAVTITGDGTGAEAIATVGANGSVTGITVTNPGNGYTTATVAITGAGSGATADAVVTPSGVITSITVNNSGGGYTSPLVTLVGGGATTVATATAYGGVDALTLGNPGSGYTFPTVDFDMPDDPNGVIAKAHVTMDGAGTITGIILDDPGSGYASAPNVVIRDGTLYDPIIQGAARATAAREQAMKAQADGKLAPDAPITPNLGAGATASATINVQSISLDTFGAGYTSSPAVVITDPVGVGSGADATAVAQLGGVTAVNVTNAGLGYVNVGMRKFIDGLPLPCYPNILPALPGGCPEGDPTAKFLPLAIPELKLYNGVEADEYEIGLVQYRTKFSSDLPATLVRGYVQLETAANAAFSEHFVLENELMDGTKVPTGYLGVTSPQWLGPIIAATKDKPVRIVFRNLLPTGADGDLFLPVDSTLMGSGMGPLNVPDPVNQGSVTDEVRNPVCTQNPKSDLCFKDNRATLHLHGGITPWISDGTPHQWITPANELTPMPEGVSVENVPDMNVCGPADDGCQTFYYTNQQSARLMFYHDHAWGITRLNVYAGEAAGYLISDNTEKTLINNGTLPVDQIPLVIQDRTFVPDAAQLAWQDPTWDVSRWGSKGNFWYHHVYMPAQNPGDPSGMSAYGRWMYGPWFWPPAAGTVYGPIANPYFNMDPKGPDGIPGNADDWTTPLAVPCNIDDPATWQYDTDPFCEPEQIPGTPNISAGMEQFNDTPVVNGVAYPTITVDPKAYRFRVLSAANDRFFNLQWYVGDPTTASIGTNTLGQPIGPTEVALKAAEVAAAQTDPVVFPTPDTSISLPGPDWVQIATEGGFLPAPVVVDGQQVTTWITDPTRFDVGNVDLHSLLLAPAERADVIVDFSQFAGQTLILYNDAPAAFPARVPSYDYYTGAPDLRPVGAPSILPGYGPNTRTVMQVKVAANPPATAFDLPGTTNDGLGKLNTAFSHKANGSGVFESGQHPIIVGQAAYNSAYGTSFAASSNCNAPGSVVTRCDGFVRVSDTSTFGFNTLKAQTAKMMMPLQPKAIHDEMNSTTFDEFGRMQANLGVEAQPPTPGVQNVTLYPYVNPQTELIDATNLPKVDVVVDVNGQPVGDVKIKAISDAADGTQIWRITHNGVDTHPIHFHLYDVQLLNRVTWDNIIIPADKTELGWKDTVRIAPLEDTIVALRPIIPKLPFELPNAVRPLSPMMPLGATTQFFNVDPQGNPTAPIVNQLVNFGWEYVYHCHILSHEEMDMMRPVTVAMPPNKPDGLAFTISGAGATQHVVLTWNDNSINETEFLVQSTTNGVNWTDAGTIQSPLGLPNTHGVRTFTDPAVFNPSLVYKYQVVAKNTVGYGAEFPSMTVQSISDPKVVGVPPAAPTNLTATQPIPQVVVNLVFRDNATNESSFILERSTNGGAFVQIATLPARNGTGNVLYSDTTVVTGNTYTYRVAATNLAGMSAYSTSNSITVVGPPAAPTNVIAVPKQQSANAARVTLSWTDASNNETGFRIQRATNAAFTAGLVTTTVPAGSTSYQTPNIARGTNYYFRIQSFNNIGPSAWVNATPFPVLTP